MWGGGAAAGKRGGKPPRSAERRHPRGDTMAFTLEARADLVRNRLYMRLTGFMAEADARKAADAVIAEMQKLRPGFAIINDIRELKPVSPEASDQLKRTQEAAVKLGYSRAIRVVGDQLITHLQWTRTLKAAHGHEIETAPTVDEAERMLERGGARPPAKPD